MSDEELSYSPRYVQVWTILSVLLGLLLLGMFVFGNHLMHAGHSVWSLLRWLCRGII
jgi:hypothetical protein